MKRNVSLEEISDGRLYGENDMVKADCRGCVGCSDCCRGMGRSIILDPYDVYRLTTGLGKSFANLMDREVELNVVDGCILPNLKMMGAQEQCPFLNTEGRCGVHALRPGICRLFPLGRYYENGAFRYFLQTGQCNAAHSKVKVGKWIDTPNLRRNREFITDWHYLLNRVEELVQGNLDDIFRRDVNMMLLQTFYLTPYDEQRDFYEQYEGRAEQFVEQIKRLEKEDKVCIHP
ncbi:MAG: YkgJ family cysteine cluster protein [Butyrivibrio sp.]|nr:YkgJ family cysteine cluster protein [Muribaculum sp.]MCM1552898.1 YkgJ family cysteine cluster protein [Butyrivibrio sp.]